MSRNALESLRSSAGRTKLQSKLQVLTNRDEVVSLFASGSSPGVSVDPAKGIGISGGGVTAALGSKGRGRRRSKLEAIASNVEANVLIQLAAGYSGARIPGATARSGSLVSARVNFEQLAEIVEDEAVVRVELGQALSVPLPVVAEAEAPAPKAATRQIAGAAKHRFGEGVLIGIVDVQGFDFSHPDFLKPDGSTRWIRIWDQAGMLRPSPFQRTRGHGQDYGSEITSEHFKAALNAAPAIGAPAFELEPQSSMVPGSHGTHVASIAAGNRGIARRAEIAGVLVSLPEGDWDRRRSFYDSSRLVHAVEYLVDLARELNLALSINISLGTNGHAHDTSAPTTRWIDSLLIEPSRCVTVAAGNAGQSRPLFEGDMGFAMGRIHTEGTIPARGLTTDIEWIVIGDGISDVSENQLVIWYSSQDQFGIQVKPPNGAWTELIAPGEFVENRRLPDGSMLSIYNELYHVANGCNSISLFLTPFFSETVLKGVPPGTWTVRLRGLEIRSGAFHAWIERDDPHPVKTPTNSENWAFPSFFSEATNVATSTVSSLACGERIVSVANLDQRYELIHPTSSVGPTREGRSKPDICAPGTEVVAANGFSGEAARWIGMTGTSMAAPYVAGTAGLMLAANPNLTSSQILGIIQSTARPLPRHVFSWRGDAGFGCLDPESCVKEAVRAAVRKDKT